jgi:lipopolysaccharide/colanic/teichoic acid biosynthesis glycosyltransferase
VEFVKRAGDVVVSFAGLVLCAPLFAIAAAAIKLDSRGPVLFRHRRAGRNLKPFYILKFRTMVDGAAETGPEVTIGADPRVTKLGRLLRKSKIDELPQLLNVLRGDMSIVGPRPQSYSYIPYYSDEDLQTILSVRPGITGPTQLWLRHEEDLLASQPNPIRFYTDELLPLKISSDKDYVKSRSILMDIEICAKTISAVASVRQKEQVVVFSAPRAHRETEHEAAMDRAA